MEGVSEEEKRALRGSKFAPLPPPSSRSLTPRLAHPGGPLKTNKAVALAKFLERKLHNPDGLSSVDLDLVQLAVNNAKSCLSSGGTSNSGTVINHVDSFGDSEPEDSVGGKAENLSLKKHKKKKKKQKKHKNQKVWDDGEDVKLKKPKKKLKV